MLQYDLLKPLHSDIINEEKIKIVTYAKQIKYKVYSKPIGTNSNYINQHIAMQTYNDDIILKECLIIQNNCFLVQMALTLALDKTTVICSKTKTDTYYIHNDFEKREGISVTSLKIATLADHSASTDKEMNEEKTNSGPDL